MPTLFMFFGIIIKMYNKKSGKHYKQHIHAEYQDQNIVISLECGIFEDEMIAKKLRLIMI